MYGYMHPSYAESLAEFGKPRLLPRCGGWILERQIPGFSYLDAMGCYPLFVCQDWSQLYADLEDIGEELVSLALVTDPFGECDMAYLQHCFKDIVIPFKEHFIVDLCRPLNEIGGKRRRKLARRALREIQVEACQEPAQFTDEWVILYESLIARHNISGIQAFSKTAFAKQLRIPGAIMLRALFDDTMIGAQVYFVQGDVVHCHLGAVSKAGYDLGAFYALDWFSIEYFAGKARWLNLGGGAGIQSDSTDGLSQYKQGWCSETKVTYFCGRIFNREKYADIVQAKGGAATDYFPAYRLGEFG